jgi:SH3-like domain-containing protein
MTKKILAPLALLCTALMLPATASALCVKVKEANLRAGPGTQYQKTWEVLQYMPLKKISQQGNWYQVEDVDGDQHWVYSPLVTDDVRCAVVKVKEANVRTGPGTRHEQSALSPVEKYYSFKVLGTKGAWVKVQDEVFDGEWIAKKLLWIQ